MVSKQEMDEGKRQEPSPVVLSEGASVALGSVFKRLNKRAPVNSASKGIEKRPRPPQGSVVLTANEEVREVLRAKKQEKKKHKEARKAKLLFENNARVIPDAATNAFMEKAFLTTATKGAVALFNAVSKAQKAAEEAAHKPVRGGPPISRDSFMSMMKAGVAKSNSEGKREKQKVDADSDETSSEPKSKAKWLKDDFLTAKSKTLRDWDREARNEYEDNPSGNVEEEEESEESGEDHSSESEDEE